MVLLYIVTPGRFFLSAHLPLALAAAADGWDVHVAAPEDEASADIRRYGFTVHTVPLARTLASPLHELGCVLRLYRLCRELSPDLVHAIAPKGTVLGGLAARLAGKPAILMKCGLGTTVTEPGFVNGILRVVIRLGVNLALSRRAWLIVQNREELDDLAVTRRAARRASVVPGAGVDCGKFVPTPEMPGPITVVLPARILRSKGIEDFVEAARLLLSRGVKARFLLAGGLDPGNSTAIHGERIQYWQTQGLVRWLEHCDDMPGLLARCHIVCLPSHGEGLPSALTEAAAAGRAIVTTDVAGCHDVVSHGINGFLVPARDPAALADALGRLIADADARAKFGQSGRRLALALFDKRIILPRILALYRALHRQEI